MNCKISSFNDQAMIFTRVEVNCLRLIAYWEVIFWAQTAIVIFLLSPSRSLYISYSNKLISRLLTAVSSNECIWIISFLTQKKYLACFIANEWEEEKREINLNDFLAIISNFMISFIWRCLYSNYTLWMCITCERASI